jgi:hypothetical protein
VCISDTPNSFFMSAHPAILIRDRQRDLRAPFFPEDPPTRIFVCVPEWTGPFDIEIDCVAVM